jgi:transposase
MADDNNNVPEPVFAKPGKRQCRSYSLEYKLSIIRQSLQPGASVADIARRNDLNANMVFNWRRLYREGHLVPQVPPLAGDFVPVRVCDGRPGHQQPEHRPAAAGARVEITLPNGVSVRADTDIEDKRLHRLLIMAGSLS